MNEVEQNMGKGVAEMEVENRAKRCFFSKIPSGGIMLEILQIVATRNHQLPGFFWLPSTG